MSRTKRHIAMAKVRVVGWEEAMAMLPPQDHPKGSLFVRCSCWMCRYGLHRRHGKAMARATIRSHRHAVKNALHMGADVPGKPSLPYTD